MDVSVRLRDAVLGEWKGEGIPGGGRLLGGNAAARDHWASWGFWGLPHDFWDAVRGRGAEYWGSGTGVRISEVRGWAGEDS